MVKKSSPKGEQLTVRVPAALKAALEKAAQEQDRSVSYVVVKLLSEALKIGQSE